MGAGSAALAAAKRPEIVSGLVTAASSLAPPLPLPSSTVTEKDREADMHDRHFLARTRRSPAQIPFRRGASARHRLAEMIGRLLLSGEVNG
jgi:hypothetical protein